MSYLKKNRKYKYDFDIPYSKLKDSFSDTEKEYVKHLKEMDELFSQISKEYDTEYEKTQSIYGDFSLKSEKKYVVENVFDFYVRHLKSGASLIGNFFAGIVKSIIEFDYKSFFEKSLDAIVIELFNKVKEKKKEVQASSERPKWETSCTFAVIDGNISTNVNIMTVSDKNRLVELYAYVLSREEFIKKAAVELGVKHSAKWGGYSFSAWKTDFKTKVAQLDLNDKKAELSELESRLDKLISPEQRRELELEEIQKLMSKHD